MFVYTLRFCNIGLRIQTPFEVQISTESEPFYVQSCDEWDVCVSFAPCDSLPALPESGLWVEDRYDTQLDGLSAAFVRNLPTEPPYCLLTQDENRILCRYLKGHESKFQDTAGILNLIGIEKILLDNSAFLLHSSFVRYQGSAILFSASCGVGKSTQASLWELHRGAQIMNGDRTGIRFGNGQWTAYGMPFAGSSGIYRNACVPLAAVVTLEQAPINAVSRLRPMDAVRRLLAETSCRRWDGVFMNGILDLLIRFVSSVPVFHLACRPDEDAVDVLHQFLNKEEIL